MDGPALIPRFFPRRLIRAGEPNRLAARWMALAYERLCPIQPVPRTPTNRRELRPDPELLSPPYAAAGGLS
jgi:hypothetical protein